MQFKSQAGFFGGDADGFRNEFVMQLKPKDLMYLKVVVKSPGLEMNAAMSELNLTYQDRCALTRLPPLPPELGDSAPWQRYRPCGAVACRDARPRGL